MVRIERRQVDPQLGPIEPNPTWFQRASDLTAALLANNGSLAINDHYRDPQVKQSLERLFRDKCAYCGIKIIGGSSWDVEHYRPKGRVHGSNHPGYWWLAYEWTNLYPACPDCNQSRRDPPRFGDPSPIGPAMGKADQFPLADESRRALTPATSLQQEDPLLLDPCSDQPEAHLSHLVNGDITAVAGSSKGLATIHICHLQRRRLRSRRKEHIDTILAMIGHVGAAGAATVLQYFSTVDREFAAIARSMQADPVAFGL